VTPPPIQIVLALVLPAASAEGWQIANCIIQCAVGISSRNGRQLRNKMAVNIPSHTDYQLTPALLGNAQGASILYLGMDAISWPSICVSENARFVMDAREEFSAGRVAHSNHILNHEHSWLEVIDKLEKFAVETATRIILEAVAVIGSIDLPRG
jgi:hypothetical protein